MYYSPRSFIHPNPATFDSPQRQYFSIPSTLIYYISQNQFSAKSLQKLQKTCKYFFAKNKIIVVNKAISSEKEDHYFYCKFLRNKKIYLSKSIKYWLNFDYTIYHFAPLLNLLKSIYRCTLETLVIYKQNLTLVEFNFLSNGPKLTWIWIDYVNIRNSNGNLVSIDKILSKFLNIKIFHYASENEIFTNKTFEKMNDLKLASNFNNFKLTIFNLSPKADISLLCKFIENNSRFVPKYSCMIPSFEFDLKMANPQIYRASLKSSVDIMFQSMEADRKPSVKIS